MKIFVTIKTPREDLSLQTLATQIETEITHAGFTPFIASKELEKRGLTPGFMQFIRQHIEQSDLLLLLYHPDLRGGLIEQGIAYALGIPVWLGGSARGLLGRRHPIQFRHARGKALKEADVVVVAGFPFDFRLKYGLGIGARAKVVAANLSGEELRKNRRPQVAAQIHPADFLRRLADAAGPGEGRWAEWLGSVRAREEARDAEIAGQARTSGELVDPVHFFLRLEEKMADDAVIVADGGDFVATAAYTVRPRAPLSWLDPGVFGTLGVGGGFAVGAATVRGKGTEVWILFGDGSCAYSLAEIDTCVRHGLAPIAVVGTDASWGQIARDQVKILGDDVGTVLRKTAYHSVAEGYGGVGLLLDDPRRIDEVLDRAIEIARAGKPVVVNVHLARSEFREGSISI